MDSANHNVLQFISAAAQVRLKTILIPLVVCSQNSKLWVEKALNEVSGSWSSHSAHHDLNHKKPDGIKELLAEAAGNEFNNDEDKENNNDNNQQLQQQSLSTNSSVLLKDHTTAEKLQIIFDLPTVEEVIGEWPCCIVRSAIVPGYLYLTDNHICFFASLPQNMHGYRKAGYLLIKNTSKIGTGFERRYFELKEDMLAWYGNATDMYSPKGKIDLKEVLVVRTSKKREHGFKIITMNKTWHFQADTYAAMLEWMNMLRKAIFKAKNTGNSVKITLPFKNILDIEQTEAFEFQQFIQIRAVGIDDHFVMDEYYFAYFTDAKETFEQLKNRWDRLQQQVLSDSIDNNNPLIASTTDSVSPSLSISDLYDVNSQPIMIQALGGNRNNDTNVDDTINTTITAEKKPKKSSSSSSIASSMTGAVSTALSVPTAIKGLLYSNCTNSSSPSLSNNNNDKMTMTMTSTTQHHPHRDTPDPSTVDIEDSSSSENEDQAVVGWLNGKRRSGMKLVYGFLGGGGNNTGSTATVYRSLDEEDEEDEEIQDNNRINSYKRTDNQKSENDHSNEFIPTLFPYEEPLEERTRINFRKYFVLPQSEKLEAVYRCSLMKTLPCYGKLYISSHHVSFNSKGIATKAKMIIPFNDILRIQKIRSRGYIFHALSILMQNKKEIFIEFSSEAKRNSCFARLFLQHKGVFKNKSSTEQAQKDIREWTAKLLEEEQIEHNDHVIPPFKTGLPVLSHTADDEPLIYQKPDKPLHFTCITIGTRGDVQPYIALCKGLMAEGHKCRIATHDEFKDWIEEHNIEYRSIGGDPSELMRLCVENNFFSVHFVMEGLRLFKGWIDELLGLTWKACEDTDVILESPSAMVGIHMAEKLRVPYFRSFPMPMTRTRSFPHPFATPNNPKGRLYNDMTYVLFDHAVWRAIATRTNDFRRDILGLPATTYEKLEVWKIPYLYCFSQSIVPSPLDWRDWIHCTGYWFLDNAQTKWKPSPELQNFLQAPDSRPIVYIGFGSIIVSDPDEITRIIVEATLLSNVRAIISRGWSSRIAGTTSDLLHRYPNTILSVQAVPHDWLFPQVRAVVHHGGAGTTAAGLRAGRPTIVKPFFADQFFWGDRVEEMGVGRCIKELTVENLSAALRVVSTDESMLRTANIVGQKIREENGVETAIQCIYRDMELARERTVSSAQRTSSDEGEDSDALLENSIVENDQEWTLIEATASGSVSPGSWRPRTS
ncbi:hypothetical protein INT45_008898 [Circinella minor]|uniref:sterol 3beta-glucosyltransferase n=1 Tax=Circinella minor TaxID=1195481 RepID=A0A8H7VLJ6_9FUNG|nr:hypothetical protein INT45_008898 [Circinella minor]